MEKNINFIVKEDENNLRVDVLINKRVSDRGTGTGPYRPRHRHKGKYRARPSQRPAP